jgi:hypothetical protein
MIRLLPQLKLGEQGKDEAKIRDQSFSAVVKAERVAMVVMCWRRAAA